MEPIPFNHSTLAGKELDYITRSVSRGQIAGDQQFSRKCQTLLEEVLEVPKALVTTSCTHALEMAAILLRIQPGDEVIVPSFTFVSTINAFVLHGAIPVFCDVREDTLNLDERQLETLITSRTRAIVPVHYAGVSCEMDSILAIASRHGVAVVEDNAHGLFGRYRDRWLGTMGDIRTRSFHETKNITCGEGGAILLNRRDLIERAEIIREKGTDRARFFRGMIDMYGWVDVGSSYVISDVLAAFLFGQLECWREIQQKRCQLWQNYDRELRTWAQLHGVLQPHVPAECSQAWHMYHLRCPTLEFRTRLIDFLRNQGITAVFHYLPLHSSSFVISQWGQRYHCPVTEAASQQILRLPFYSDMQNSQFERVVEAMHRFPG
ncbi:MAG: dTDP-4-amino-4,6-dideoxygalactose transaminase [Acidimicrobiales bacterium]|nr:dTDP-4-amino-4,6-dideoxygalactose transaminase [Acidimicrobiales bacterium]